MATKILIEQAADKILANLKRAYDLVDGTLATSPLPVQTAVRVATQLNIIDGEIGALISGVDSAKLQTYIQDRYATSDPTYDPVTEIQSTRTALQTFRDWIDANMPRDSGTNAVLLSTWTVSSGYGQVMMTTAQRDFYLTQANTFLNTFE